MPLTHSQKKYLKKNIKKLSLVKISAYLGVPETEIQEYFKSQWRKEKYHDFLKKERISGNNQIGKVSLVEIDERKEPFDLRVWFTKNWKILVFLTLLVSVTYFNSLKNDFVSDDITTIKNSPLIGQTSYFMQLPYFNLVSPRALTIFIIHQFFGLNPLFYRLSNILPHLGSTILIYFLIKRFFASPIPLATASIFAVHPILTEGVSWISGGPYSNGTFFALFSFFLYLQSQNKKLWFYLLSIIFFLLATLFTEKFLILPLIIVLYEFCGGNIKRNWKRLFPFFAVSASLLITLFNLLGNRVGVSAKTSYAEPGINNPFIQIPIVVTTYLKLIFWPQDLSANHSEGIFTTPQYLLSLVVFFLFLGLIIYFFKKDRRIFFWLSFFFIALSPTLTPFKVSDVIAERYVYFASLGVFVFIAWLIQKIGVLTKNQKVTYLVFIIIIMALSTRTILRNMDWKDQNTLWVATAKTSPLIAQNHVNLGALYAQQNNWEKAIEEFKTAIKIEPKYERAYHNLATAYYVLKKYDLAVENYQKALSLDPNISESYQNLAVIYLNSGKLDLAKENTEKAININPDKKNSYALLGTIYQRLGEKQKAKEQFEKALELDPEDNRIKQLLIELEK